MTRNKLVSKKNSTAKEQKGAAYLSNAYTGPKVFAVGRLRLSIDYNIEASSCNEAGMTTAFYDESGVWHNRR